MKGSVDAVCFTTAIQVRSLFDFAREKGYLQKLKPCFAGENSCDCSRESNSRSVREEGIERVVVPEYERMGAMIVELVHYFEKYKLRL